MVQTLLVTLPIAIGVAVNPLAIVAGIVLLGSDDPRGRGLPFLAGWVLGLALLILLAVGVVGWRMGVDRDGGRPLIDLGRVVAGGVLVAAGSWMLARRQSGRAPRSAPAWLATLDRVTGLRALGLGGFLAVFSIKNLLLVASAGAAMGAASLGMAGLVVVAAVFLAVCSTGVCAPVVARLRGGPAGVAVLLRWRAWLVANAGVLTAATLLLMGGHLLLSGLTDWR